jgi:hypothetical protein
LILKKLLAQFNGIIAEKLNEQTVIGEKLEIRTLRN